MPTLACKILYKVASKPQKHPVYIENTVYIQCISERFHVTYMPASSV